MANVAFGVRQTADGIGTTDVDIRKMLAHKWVNKGVVGGLSVKGSTGLTYIVGAGMAICSKGAGDGFTEAYFDGGQTPAVAANTSSMPRIDVVYITAHDKSKGDADNLVTIGVVQGTPSGTPKAPTVPQYATEVARMRLAGGSTSTNGAIEAESRQFAIPYGSSLGIIADVTNKTTTDVTAGTPWTFASSSIVLPTDRNINVKISVSVQAKNPTTYNWLGSGYVDWLLDGTVIRAFRFTCSPDTVISQCFEDVLEVDAGSHTIAARLWGSGAAPASNLTASYYAGSYPGQRLIISDGGVSA